MADVDCVEMFIITGSLHKNLIVQVVQELGDEYVNIPHDFQHIQTLNDRKYVNWYENSYGVPFQKLD